MEKTNDFIQCTNIKLIRQYVKKYFIENISYKCMFIIKILLLFVIRLFIGMK